MNNNKIQTSNLILNVVCGSLVVLGAWQIFSGRAEDGLINIIIGTSLSTIPFTNNEFNLVTAPIRQKIFFIFASILVVCSTIATLVLALK